LMSGERYVKTGFRPYSHKTATDSIWNTAQANNI
jgi:hypothetical protein